MGAIWHEVGVCDGLGLSPRWLSWACPGHQLESRISRQREIVSVPCLEMNHVRALGWRGTCSGSVVPATPPYGLRSLGCGSQGPTHRRARTPVERCKKKRQEELLLQAWQPRTQDRGARSEPNQRARSTDPRQQTAWIDIIELSFNIAPNFCGVWTKKLRFFSGSCACCRARIDGRAGRLGDCRPIVPW